MREYVLGATGASGSLCGIRLLRELASHPEVARVSVIASRGARRVAREELGLREDAPEEFRRAFAPEAIGQKVRWLDEDDLAAPVSSGSYPCNGMAIVPCSMGTLASISRGVSRNLIHRAADVTLKERRPLVLGIRESPLSLVHIENLRIATLAGAIIAPITPLFYNRPIDLDEIVEQYAARILDLLHLPHAIGKRWKADA